ncbi:MAG: hypothetical protein GAK45_01143 [Pseudomonas citronellolis]|nr:MAG: hypothetical protein GAK45_01143 [Pseudomonas citronellolis]
MHRSLSTSLRNGALASIGLYAIVVLVLLALAGGYRQTQRVADDPVDRSALFQRVDHALPVALTSLQQLLDWHS